MGPRSGPALRVVEGKVVRFLLFFLGVGVCFMAVKAAPVRAAEESLPVAASSIGVELRGEKVLLSIHPSALNKDFLFVKNLAGQRLIRWVRSGDGIDLVVPVTEREIGKNSHPAANIGGPLSEHWQPGIVARFPIIAVQDDGSFVFDATQLFLRDVPGLPSGEGVTEGSRSSVERVLSHDNLVEVIASITIPADTLRPFNSSNYASSVPLTHKAYWSILKLPDEPMRARQYDPRMGFMQDERNLARLTYPASILRHRLEKLDSALALSDPQEPIVFYLAEDTPEWMKPSLVAGIEAWEPAFEAAGFTNAIEVRDFPESDPDFFEQSLRYSIVRIFDKTDARRSRSPRLPPFGGGTIDLVYDPRSGELLKSDIIIPVDNDALFLYYFTFCAALDSRAQTLPLSEEVRSDLVQALVEHEAGHTFGLLDGNFGDYTYPTESLRDEDWLAENGFTPSVMNYARCNYVAQPEDNLPPQLLIPRVGPADIHQIRWGYTVFDDLGDRRQEVTELESIVREVDEEPWKTFIRGVYGISPQLYSNAVDSDDPIIASSLGLLNLRRTLDLLEDATLHEDGGVHLLEQAYFQTLERWETLMGHVATLVGGYTFEFGPVTHESYIYSPIPADLQKEAFEFLAIEAFQTPTYLIDTDISRHFEVAGTIDNVSSHQVSLLNDLLKLDRLENFVEAELVSPPGASVYTIAEYLSDVRQAIWSELGAPGDDIDPFRMRLQAAHIARLQQTLSMTSNKPEIAAAIRADLELLSGELNDSVSVDGQLNSWQAHLGRMADLVERQD